MPVLGGDVAEIAQAARLKFPGMRSSEASLMRRWLTLHEWEFDRFEYNVRIGAARDPGPEYAEWVREAAKQCSQLRIDAIAWKGPQATIVELKRWGFPDGVQQLALYGAVWAMDNPDSPRPALLLVVGIMSDAAWATANTAHIPVEVLGFA